MNLCESDEPTMEGGESKGGGKGELGELTVVGGREEKEKRLESEEIGDSLFYNQLTLTTRTTGIPCPQSTRSGTFTHPGLERSIRISASSGRRQYRAIGAVRQ